MLNRLKQLTFYALIGIYILSIIAAIISGSIYPSRIDYTTVAELQLVPLNDKELEQWLLEQSFVDSASVHREGKLVVVRWRNNRQYFGAPNADCRDGWPTLFPAFEKFGYIGLVNSTSNWNNPDSPGGD